METIKKSIADFSEQDLLELIAKILNQEVLQKNYEYLQWRSPLNIKFESTDELLKLNVSAVSTIAGILNEYYEHKKKILSKNIEN